MEGQNVILFDGECNLCNGFVNFVIKRDKENLYHFAPLQSRVAKDLLKEDRSIKNLSTIVLVENGKILTQSTAALRIIKHLSGGWKLLYGLIIIPKFIRDAFYILIARNRYRWFGKKEHCMIPTPAVQSKFLSYE